MVHRAALIGCGKIGSEFDSNPTAKGVYSHAGAYNACSRTQLAAVCDTDADKLKRAGERWKVRTFGDARQMLHEIQPDIVSICTPDSTHYAMLRIALASPHIKAIFAEKPLALEPSQAQEIVDEANQRGILVVVNYSRRYSKTYWELKNFLDGGAIGPISAVSGFYTKGIIHNGTHWLDLARFLVGDISQVWGFRAEGEETVDPTLDGVIEFANGVRGTLRGCSFADEVSFFEMDIVGDRGRVTVSASGNNLRFYELSDDSAHAGYKEFRQLREIDGGLSDVMVIAVEDLVEALTNGEQPRCAGTDALVALKIAVALRESARAGVPIEL